MTLELIIGNTGYIPLIHGCKGFCQTHPECLPGLGANIYIKGMKYCKSCEYKIYTTALFCFCCHRKYRVGTKSLKHKLEVKRI